MSKVSSSFEIVFHLCLLSTLASLTSVSQTDEYIITPEDEQVYSECDKRGPDTYLIFKKDGKCYQANTQGPCGPNMILYPHPTSSKFGFCDCFDAQGETEEEVAFLNSRNLSHCIKDVRGQIYVPERDRCYSVFDQGPCPLGKWLVLNGTFYPVCARNSCQYSLLKSKSPNEQDMSNPLSPKYVFALSSYSDCYETMSRGYCAKSYELRFSSNHFIPQCRYIPPENSRKPCPETSSGEIRQLRCKPGSRYDFLTKCSRSINPRK